MKIIKKGILYLILLSGLIGVVYSVFNIAKFYNEYNISDSKYKQLTDIYKGNNMNVELPEKDNVINPLYEINEDYVGWLTVEGTEVEYPVVLGNDNEYYLDHNFYGESDKVGAVFMDYRNSRDLIGRNTIIYGHNMTDTSMFGSLKKLLEVSLEADTKITLNFQGEMFEWEIITAYKTFDADWMQVEFENDTAYADYLNNLDSYDVISPEIELNESDNLITLATCTPNDRNERLIVHGKLIKEA